MKRLLIFALGVNFMTKVEAAAMYKCFFGPDDDGNYSEEVVETKIAMNCESFCDCIGIMDSTCYFGPDQKGNFIKETGVSSEMADSCNRHWCICDTHDFENGETFESVFEARSGIAIDITNPGRP